MATGNRRPITKQGRWRGFSQDPSAGIKHRKRKVFQYTYFADMVNAIVKAGTSHGATTPLKLLNNKIQGTNLTFENDVLPDAFVVSGDSTENGDVTLQDVSLAGYYTSFAHEGAQEEV